MGGYHPSKDANTPEEALRLLFGDRAAVLIDLLKRSGISPGLNKSIGPREAYPTATANRRLFGLLPPSNETKSLADAIAAALDEAQRSAFVPLMGEREDATTTPYRPPMEPPSDPYGESEISKFNQRLENLRYLRSKSGVDL